ncbi:MAG: penicillin-binding transpeptidase domain-containing protein [Tissierellia bacterium]|nr:penicillin-binding transpeptidase domain-containing protein [Tissierellia bacterium]
MYIAYTYVSVSVVHGEEYKKKALEQWTKTYENQRVRGEILDREGNRIAISVPRYRIWLNPKAFQTIESEDDKDLVIDTICEVFSMEKGDIREKIKKNRRFQIALYATEEEKNKLYQSPRMDGLEISEVNKRFYPDGVIYNHILGFTNIDAQGLSGIELTYNEKLHGRPSRVVKMTDNRNVDLPFMNKTTYGGSGYGDVVLTIDDRIQRIAHEECMKALVDNAAKAVSVLVMDPKTGDILAMTDTNTYDNNNPRLPISDEQAKEWEDKESEEMVDLWAKNWQNLNVNTLYEPGSTFKAFTLAAAIEEGMVDDSTELYCNGAITDIPGVTLRCVRWENPHGQLNITDAFSESCNVAFVQIGRILQREKFLKYIKAFGFGEKSGIELNGEQAGLIPNSIQEMTPVRLATATYGQGLAATNIQVAMGIAAIVNGGDLLVPRIVKEIRYKDGETVRIPVQSRRRVISKFTSDKMREIMEYAVIHGNKRGMVEGYRVGGKSGTSMIAEHGVYMKDKYVASFVGVAPIEDPRLLVLVVVDQPGKGVSFGGAVAGPVSANIMREALPLMGIHPSADNEQQGEQTTQIPDVIGMTLVDAAKSLREAGLQYYIEQDITDNNYIVSEMSPQGGVYIQKGSIVDLILKKAPKDKIMPDFTGMTVEEAKTLAKKLNIHYSIEGEGHCIWQSIVHGEAISKETELILKFE